MSVPMNKYSSIVRAATMVAEQPGDSVAGFQLFVIANEVWGDDEFTKVVDHAGTNPLGRNPRLWSPEEIVASMLIISRGYGRSCSPRSDTEEALMRSTTLLCGMLAVESGLSARDFMELARPRQGQSPARDLAVAELDGLMRNIEELRNGKVEPVGHPT